MDMGIVGIAGILVALAGAGVLAAGYRGRPQTALAYLDEVGDGVTPDARDAQLAEPFLRRVIRPAVAGVLERARAVLPSSYLDRVHGDLVKAGLARRMTAEEFTLIQGASAAGAVALLLLILLVRHPTPRIDLLCAILLPTIGLLGPAAWLRRRVDARCESIRDELPDVIDLLTISVEAGLGFEQAMEATVAQFRSPLSEELALTLHEMSLGLSRRDALENLKRRAGVADLANFVLVLVQADALGMPISRVLRTQADEMRNKRRQRAREKAAKLPVKILFPLVAFVFPPTMGIVLGPAMLSIFKVFHHH